MNNKAKGWLFLAGAIAAEVTGSLSLKGALELPALYALVVVGYLGAFVFLSLVLRTGMALGVAYGIWGASGVALTALLSLLMGIGIVIVIAGVLCVELGAQAGHKKKAEVA